MTAPVGIVKGQRDLLVERPYSELRVEHIAARPGVGKAAIYQAFATSVVDAVLGG